MKTYNVAILGIGMVGQRFVKLLDGHPWFKVTHLAASGRSAGKTFGQAMEGRWAFDTPIPADVKNITVMDADADKEKIAGSVDFVFCAIDADKETTRAIEESYAKLECPVISNTSAFRTCDDVPMIIPEINPEHAQIIPYQRKRLGTKRGFIAVKSNCSIQSYVPALHPLMHFGLEKVLACTYQAISGAGKTFESWPEMTDNVIPYIGGGEEEKSEKEPLKIWGSIKDGKIIDAASPQITAQCIRVPVTDGHMAAVFASFAKKPEIEEIKRLWDDYKGEAQILNLPSAPKKFIRYFEEADRPQTKLDRDLENGMGISLGRLRPDTQYDIKFIGLSHNTVRGAAGGGVLMAEVLCAKGYI
ncbi:MAG: aspartate-semialdehyde dehydrogenase [Oscillospiraceae bacterium]|nr:aspartate-semialdehyde dehydrogenase [Oscillospiraceae bacterium]